IPPWPANIMRPLAATSNAVTPSFHEVRRRGVLPSKGTSDSPSLVKTTTRPAPNAVEMPRIPLLAPVGIQRTSGSRIRHTPRRGDCVHTTTASEPANVVASTGVDVTLARATSAPEPTSHTPTSSADAIAAATFPSLADAQRRP